MISTEMIVLTKQPYRESALLLNGFSRISARPVWWRTVR